MDKLILFCSVFTLSFVVNSQKNIRDNFMDAITSISLQISQQLSPECEVNLVENEQKCVNNAFNKFSTSYNPEILSETDQKPNPEKLQKQIYYDMCCGTWFIKDCILEFIKVNSSKF